MAGLTDFTQRLAGNLSGGMKQKLALICTLLSSPRLLLLDEPTVGVDPLSRRELWAIIERLVRTERLTVLLSTAYMDEAYSSDKIYMIHHGEIIINGTPAEIIKKAAAGDMTEAFLKLLARAGKTDYIPRQKVRHNPLLLTPPRNTDYVIKVENLIKKFGDFTAVSNTSFSVRKGEIFGLLGPNGAGKTTTFRMLCGLLPATGGKLSVAGENLRSAPTKARQKIGYVAQKFSLYGNLSVYENLYFFGGVYALTDSELEKRIKEVAQEFSLTEYLDTPAEDLPGGYHQRLAMSAALLHQPPLLFLDEPTSGVDPLARTQLWSKITALADSGTTIIITTHFMEEADYCDRIMIQDHGKLLAIGTPEEIRRSVSSSLNDTDIDMEEVFIKIVEKNRTDIIW